MNKIKLSKTERLILANHYEILQHLDVENKESHEYHKKIVEKGYEGEYESLFLGIDDGTPYEVSAEVWDILDMYIRLSDSYKKMKDKSKVEKQAITFQGFDGTNEAQHCSYTEFLIYEKNHYTEHKIKSKDHNSHMPMLPKYRRMVLAWKNCKNRFELTEEELINIVNA